MTMTQSILLFYRIKQIILCALSKCHVIHAGEQGDLAVLTSHNNVLYGKIHLQHLLQVRESPERFEFIHKLIGQIIKALLFSITNIVNVILEECMHT